MEEMNPLEVLILEMFKSKVSAAIKEVAPRLGAAGRAEFARFICDCGIGIILSANPKCPADSEEIHRLIDKHSVLLIANIVGDIDPDGLQRAWEADPEAKRIYEEAINGSAKPSTGG